MPKRTDMYLTQALYSSKMALKNQKSSASAQVVECKFGNNQYLKTEDARSSIDTSCSLLTAATKNNSIYSNRDSSFFSTRSNRSTNYNFYPSGGQQEPHKVTNLALQLPNDDYLALPTLKKGQSTRSASSRRWR